MKKTKSATPSRSSSKLPKRDDDIIKLILSLQHQYGALTSNGPLAIQLHMSKLEKERATKPATTAAKKKAASENPKKPATGPQEVRVPETT